jgi:hypothetical protein
MRADEVSGAAEQATASECRLSGLGVSPGIAIGPAYIAEGGDLPVRESHLQESEIELERGRFAEAVAVSLRQLRKLKTKAAGLPESAAEEVGYLLDAHLAMLSNSRLVRGVDHRITRARINAERAVQLEIDEIAESFASMRDAYLAARIEDIRGSGHPVESNGAQTSFPCLGPDPRNPSGPAVIRAHRKGRTYDRNRPGAFELPCPCETGAVHIWIPDDLVARIARSGGLSNGKSRTAPAEGCLTTRDSSSRGADQPDYVAPQHTSSDSPLQGSGRTIAGTPAQVRDHIATQSEAAGAAYFVCDFAFGSIVHHEAMQSVELLRTRVMPPFADT